MCKQKSRYIRIMDGIFGGSMIAMQDWDWVEFFSDIENSARSMPSRKSRNQKTSSYWTVLMLYGDGLTLKEIGACIDVSRERARQIISIALRLMRHPKRSDRLQRWRAK